jgi:hypothetical protein
MAFLLIAALIRGPADVESLTAAADLVVHAQVSGRSSAYGVGGGEIFTTIVLHPIETWKGDPATEVRLVIPGGEVGELSQTVAGMARFRDGEEVVVFLKRGAGGVFGLQRMALGKFAVGAPSGLPKRALRDRRGLQCLGCSAAEQDDLTLDELRARVLRSARK